MSDIEDLVMEMVDHVNLMGALVDDMREDVGEVADEVREMRGRRQRDARKASTRCRDRVRVRGDIVDVVVDLVSPVWEGFDTKTKGLDGVDRRVDGVGKGVDGARGGVVWAH